MLSGDVFDLTSTNRQNYGGGCIDQTSMEMGNLGKQETGAVAVSSFLSAGLI